VTVSAKRSLWVWLLWAAFPFAVSAATPAPTTAIVTVAEGASFNLIRGSAMFAATKAVSLSPGDMIESQPDTFLILEFRCGSTACAVAGMGPSTRAYWVERSEGPTLAILRGWVKVDTLSSAQNVAFKVQGTRLGAASSAGTYIVHAGEGTDEVFHESGTVTLWVQKPDGSGTSRNSKPNEFASRTGSGEVQIQPRPGTAFSNALPAAFRDPLPIGMSAALHGKTEPKFVRDVSYEDVSDWLAAPRHWRQGFIVRFRARLKDPGFFHALDTHMSAHPEWERILHPPPPSDTLPAPAEPAKGQPAKDGQAEPQKDPGETHHGHDQRPSPVGKHVPAVIPLPNSEASMNACPYPEQSRRQGQTGSVGLLVYISPGGDVLNTRVDESSGSDALDEAAASCVREKGHFAPKRLSSRDKGYWRHLKFNWSIGN
jgi:TonB family protein